MSRNKDTTRLSARSHSTALVCRATAYAIWNLVAAAMH